MIKRVMEQTVRSALEAFLGPRQVGKTTLALAVAGSIERTSLYLDLERDSDQNKLTDAELYLSQQGQKLVILDEVQRRPTLFPLLRSLVDERIRAGERAGHFLVLGSGLLHRLANIPD